MDANETLKMIRDCIDEGRLHVASDLFKALDEWLSKGGFPPDDWTPKVNDDTVIGFPFYDTPDYE